MRSTANVGLGKPHNLIRHPDMPRGVFWLLWDCIRKNLPTAPTSRTSRRTAATIGYAIVTPIDGGYLSVRLKPSSPHFEIVRPLYADLLSREANDKISPAESAGLLQRQLGQKGFADNDAIMASSLIAKIQHAVPRDRADAERIREVGGRTFSGALPR